MSLQNIEIIIGIMLALLASILGVYKIYAEVREKSSHVHIDMQWIESPNGDRLFSFRILNYGLNAVHIYQVGYGIPLYWNNMPWVDPNKWHARRQILLSRVFPIYLKTGHTLQFYVHDPEIHTLQPNERCFVYDEAENLTRQLRKIGFSGELEITGFCKDLADRKYKTEPYRFNIETLEITYKKNYFAKVIISPRKDTPTVSGLMQGLLIGLIPALVVSIFTAYITVRLSLKQFYSQRWWERKAEAYSNIIEHLSDLQYQLEQWFGEEIGVTILDEGEKERLREGYKQAEHALRKAAATGAYIISKDTATTLEEAIKVFREPDARYSVGNWLEEMEKDYLAVKTSISAIREYAKADLHIK